MAKCRRPRLMGLRRAKTNGDEIDRKFPRQLMEIFMSRDLGEEKT